METNFKVLATASLLTILTLIIELTATHSLQESSSDYINSMQQNRTSASKNFFIIISLTSEYLAMVFGLIFFVLTRSKFSYLSLYITFFATWLGDILKMLIAHPRPFWYDSRIKAIQCSIDYGSPSGHAITVGAVIIFVYWINIHRNLIIATSIAVVCLGLLALDRNYLGLHFYFQVVLGYSFAFLVVSLAMHRMFWLGLQRVFQDFQTNLAVNGVLVGLLAVGGMIYLVRDPEMKEEWKKNYEKECSGGIDKQKALFGALLESSCLMILVGVNFGRYLNRSEKGEGWKYGAAAIGVLAVGGIVEQVCEGFAKGLPRAASFLLFCGLRLVIGAYVAAFVPYSLSFCFKTSQKEDYSSIHLSNL